MILSGLKDYGFLQWNQRHRSKASLERYQEKRVLKMVRQAVSESLFYQKLYAGHDISSMAGFRRLPTINKAVMMDSFNELNTAGLDLDELMSYAVDKELRKDYLGYYQDQFVVGLSSGTSGNKGIYITPKELTKRLPFVFMARGGVGPGMLPLRILFLLRVFSQGFDDINAPLINLKYLGTMTPIETIIDAINAGRINVLMAPPSLLRLLIPHVQKILHPISRIVSYAEVLEKEEKLRLEKVFGCRVVEIYQASEGQIGSPCRHGQLHINEDLVFVELFDKQGALVTEAGKRASKMLVTNLVNTSQPLIRYEMNDLVVLGEPCTCGSAFRVIDRVVGRADDVMHFTTPGGKLQHVFPDLMSRWIITTSDLIREFKVVQQEDESLEVIVDPMTGDKVVLDDLRESLVNRLQSELEGFNIMVDVHVNYDVLGLPKSGKKCQRFFVKSSNLIDN